jgi:hypothetical protein
MAMHKIPKIGKVYKVLTQIPAIDSVFAYLTKDDIFIVIGKEYCDNMLIKGKRSYFRCELLCDNMAGSVDFTGATFYTPYFGCDVGSIEEVSASLHIEEALDIEI